MLDTKIWCTRLDFSPLTSIYGCTAFFFFIFYKNEGGVGKPPPKMYLLYTKIWYTRLHFIHIIWGRFTNRKGLPTEKVYQRKRFTNPFTLFTFFVKKCTE